MSNTRLKHCLYAVVAAFLALAAIRYGGAYFVSLEFDDYVEQQVKFASRSRRSVDDVRAAVVKKSEELGIGVRPRDIHIARRGPSFTLSFSYEQPVDMLLYQDKLEFSVSRSGEVFDR
jgi:hypothetical protein